LRCFLLDCCLCTSVIMSSTGRSAGHEGGIDCASIPALSRTTVTAHRAYTPQLYLCVAQPSGYLRKMGNSIHDSSRSSVHETTCRWFLSPSSLRDDLHPATRNAWRGPRACGARKNLIRHLCGTTSQALLAVVRASLGAQAMPLTLVSEWTQNRSLKRIRCGTADDMLVFTKSFRARGINSP
jgi:hypothetical protein